MKNIFKKVPFLKQKDRIVKNIFQLCFYLAYYAK